MQKDEYKRAFDGVSAPEDLEERVMRRIAPRREISAGRLVLIVCAVLILGCGAVFASEIAGGWLNGIIGLSGGGAPEGSLQEIGQTAEADGVRITLADVVTDGERAYITLDMESTDGRSFAPDGTTPVESSIYVHEEVKLAGDGSISLRFVRLDDGSDPAHAQLALEYCFSHSHTGEELELTVTALDRMYSEEGEDGVVSLKGELLAEGEWRFRFTLRESTVKAVYECGSCTVTVTPLGITADGVGGVSLMDRDAALKLADGTVVPLAGGGVSRKLHNSKVTEETYQADLTMTVDPAQAEALMISGEEMKLIPVR